MMAGKAMVHSKCVRSYIRTVGISFLICVVLVSHSRSHPQCLDFFPPFKATRDLTFCREYSDFGCCTSVRDGELRQKYNNLIDQLEAIYPVLPVCNSYVKDILCQECSPYASHIFDAETTQIIAPLPGLCTAYCLDFAHCGHVVSFLTTDQQLQSSLDVSLEYFCELVEIGDMDYCYPDIVQNDVFIHELVTAGEGEGCICVQEFANGLRNPLAGVHAGDGTHRFFIAEQIGVVYVFLKNGTKINEPFLDIRTEVLTSSRRGDERGFLGLSFHPDYENNGRLFIYYSVGTLSDQKIRISEMRVSSDDMNKANTSTERVLLEIDQPAPNHNGGQLLFGEDGYLYLFVGDGGKGGDPFGEIGNGQDLESLLGAVLRIDIDGEENGRPYRIPSDNPFLNVSNAKPEIYAYGTRNMWRCSVDRGDDVTGEGRGRIFCGDVGQDSYEEIDIIEKGGNFGWRMKEGFSCYDDDMCTDDAMGEDILPIHAYSHSVGKSVTGGYVYRGCQSPNLKGHYIFGDFVNGRLFKLIEDKNTGEWNNFDICLGDNSVCNNGLIGTFPGKILSFGEDESGEVYILSTDHESNTHSGGKVHKIVDPGRRGDPLDCDVEHKDVVVIGPTTDFEPSASATLPPTVTKLTDSNEIPKEDVTRKVACFSRCPSYETRVNTEVFCKADFAFKAKVVGRKWFQHEKRLQLDIFSVFRLNSSIINYQSSGLSIWVQDKSGHCKCPKLRMNRTYFILGKYDYHKQQFIVTETTITRGWSNKWAITARYHASLCWKQNHIASDEGSVQKLTPNEANKFIIKIHEIP